ncbi:hypothetical protein JCM17843_27800 [Kordiimonadales bacterium JCM 17843]|nr:hypothetical protein JCM17843_27800 [Kordiimonadales bacterium JCM 17843]
MKSIRSVWIFLLLAALLGGGAYSLWQARQSDLPEGFSRANGRIEAERIDISLKFGGRIAEILVDEGDMVTAGDVIARVDSTELEAQIRAAEAATRQAEQEYEQAVALVAQREGELDYAEAELKRAETLAESGHGTAERVDQRRSQHITAKAALNTARAQIAATQAAIEAAQAHVAALKANLADYT